MIKKRNLDPSLVQWIMTQTGLGPGVGEIFYVVPAKSSTSRYRNQLESMGVDSDQMYTLPSLAYADMTNYRNDVMLILPGVYTETARIAWSKDWTHMIGLGGPNVDGDHTLGGVTIYNATANQAETIDVTGDRCQFQNVWIGNGGGHANNVSAVNVDAWGCYFKNVKFMGLISDEQVADEDCCSLSIDRLGHFPLFEDCIIGQSNWNVRTYAVSQGHLRFRSTTEPAPQDGIFRRCQFRSRSDTATVVMVVVAAAQGADRTWLFEDCIFTNFSNGNTTEMTRVFYTAGGRAHMILLKDCLSMGYARWTDQDRGVRWMATNQADAASKGGIGAEPTGD